MNDLGEAPEIQASSRSSLVRQGILFVAFGAVGALTNFTIYTGLVTARVHYVAASFAGWLTGLVLVFILNRRFTFGNKQPVVPAFLRTVAVYLTQQTVMVAGLIICSEVFRMSPVVAYIVNLPIAVSISFIGMKFFAMAHRSKPI